LFQGQKWANLSRAYSHIADDPGSYWSPPGIRGEEKGTSQCVSKSEEDQCPSATKTISEYARDKSVDRAGSNRQGQDCTYEKWAEAQLAQVDGKQDS
jgi:hypothetical protein